MWTDDTIAKLEIIHYPDPRLKRPARPVMDFGADLQKLVRRMFVLMREAKGVGLAAPQLGIDLRFFVMNATGEPADEWVVVNPRIVARSGMAEAEEGCLSLPGIHIDVRRPTECEVEGHDVIGRPFGWSLKGMPARIFQHELDHLDGVLIIDRMGPADRIATKKVLRALEEDAGTASGHQRR